MILEKTYDILKRQYAHLVNNLEISDLRVGLFLTSVLLSDGSAGVASTYKESKACRGKDERYSGDFSPGRITGKKISRLFETNPDIAVKTSVKLAVINALSSSIIEAKGYRILEDTDPVDLIDLNHPRKITIVGAFRNYLKRIDSTRHHLRVLELNEDAVPEKHRKYYVPAEEYKTVLPDSDVIIITGLTLVNGTIDNLLEVIPANSKVIVVGPSGNMLPDLLFQKGVSITGATRIVDPRALLDITAQAGEGYHLFPDCARKICILNPEKEF